MRASLALRHGVLWIARCVRVARLAPFDVNGRRLGPGFAFRGVEGGRTEVRGIAVDDDRRVWVADAASGSVRAFTVSGAEIAEIQGADDPESDHPGAYGDPAGIAAQGVESDARLLLSRRGTKRHALLLLDPARGTVHSLRPNGDPQGEFSGLAGVALAGRLAFACEAGRRSVQVFRDGEFHYRISVPGPTLGASSYIPRAVAALADGRSVVACTCAEGGAVFLFNSGGRCLLRLASCPAGGSPEANEIENPSGVVVAEGESDHTSCALVLDRDGDRVQAFTLDGRCLGSFHDGHSCEESQVPDPWRTIQALRDPSRKGRPRRG